jgi:hypothetical protein
MLPPPPAPLEPPLVWLLPGPPPSPRPPLGELGAGSEREAWLSVSSAMYASSMGLLALSCVVGCVGLVRRRLQRMRDAESELLAQQWNARTESPYPEEPAPPGSGRSTAGGPKPTKAKSHRSKSESKSKSKRKSKRDLVPTADPFEANNYLISQPDIEDGFEDERSLGGRAVDRGSAWGAGTQHIEAPPAPSPESPADEPEAKPSSRSDKTLRKSPSIGGLRSLEMDD